MKVSSIMMVRCKFRDGFLSGVITSLAHIGSLCDICDKLMLRFELRFTCKQAEAQEQELTNSAARVLYDTQLKSYNSTISRLCFNTILLPNLLFSLKSCFHKNLPERKNENYMDNSEVVHLS